MQLKNGTDFLLIQGNVTWPSCIHRLDLGIGISIQFMTVEAIDGWGPRPHAALGDDPEHPFRNQTFYDSFILHPGSVNGIHQG